MSRTRLWTSPSSAGTGPRCRVAGAAVSGGTGRVRVPADGAKPGRDPHLAGARGNGCESTLCSVLIFWMSAGARTTQPGGERLKATPMRGWRNRQTRWIQVPVPERAWGFNSPLAHHEEAVLLRTKVRRGPASFCAHSWCRSLRPLGRRDVCHRSYPQALTAVGVRRYGRGRIRGWPTVGGGDDHGGARREDSRAAGRAGAAGGGVRRVARAGVRRRKRARRCGSGCRGPRTRSSLVDGGRPDAVAAVEESNRGRLPGADADTGRPDGRDPLRVPARARRD